MGRPTSSKGSRGLSLRARERMEEISAFSPAGFTATLLRTAVYYKVMLPTLTNLIMGFSRMGIG